MKRAAVTLSSTRPPVLNVDLEGFCAGVEALRNEIRWLGGPKRVTRMRSTNWANLGASMSSVTQFPGGMPVIS